MSVAGAAISGRPRGRVRIAAAWRARRQSGSRGQPKARRRVARQLASVARRQRHGSRVSHFVEHVAVGSVGISSKLLVLAYYILIRSESL